MANTGLSRRDYYDDGSSTNYTTIIVVVVVIVVLKICLIIGLCYYRNKKQRERAARGCNCFNGTDYYCLPWWYWSSNNRCHCGAYNNTVYNAPPPPAYTAGAGFSDGSRYPPTQYTSGPRTEARMWNTQQESVPLKPAEQVYANGRYY